MTQTDETVILVNSRKFLRFQLIWPKRDRDLGSIRHFVKYLFFILSTCILLYGSVAHLIVTLYEKNGASIDLDISIISSVLGVYIFNTSFLVNLKKISKAFRDLSDFKTFDKPPGFDEFNNRLNTYSKWHQIYICVTITLICLPRILERKNCEAKNVEMGLSEVCGLVANVWFPFKVDFFPVKHIIFLLQFYSSYFSYAAASTVSFTLLESMLHVIFRIIHVKDLFLQTLNERDFALRKVKLGRCVHQHNFVVNIAENLSSAYSASMMVHILLTGVVLACNLYQLMQTPQINTIALFVGWFISLLMVAAVGQRLTDECLVLRDEIYNVDWYNLDLETQKDLIFLLVRCKKPLYMNAGAFGLMSYSIVLSILKTAYSILSVMTGSTM